MPATTAPVPPIPTHKADVDADGMGDACDLCPQDPLNDVDGDGVCGDTDACADSILSGTIVIDGRDSGVVNSARGDGCTMADEIAKVEATARNHGDFVSGVIRLTNQWTQDDRLSGKDKGRIQSIVAQNVSDDR